MNLIFQYYFGEMTESAELSKQSFSRYANKIGATHHFSTNESFIRNSVFHNEWATSMRYFFEMLRVVYDPIYDEYDKVMYCDCDILAVTDENIFDIFTGEVGGVVEGDAQTQNDRLGGNRNVNDKLPLTNPKMKKELTRKFESTNMPMVESKPPFSLYEHHMPFSINSGVVLWSKEGRIKARERFDRWEAFLYDSVKTNNMKGWMHDQLFITGQIPKHGLDFQPLHPEWNDNPSHYRHLNYPEDVPLKFWHYANWQGKEEMLQDRKKYLDFFS
jgi:hypothetical protein